MIGLNTLNYMGCLEGMRQIADCSVDLIIADPPYGINFCNSRYYNDKDVFNVYEMWIKEMYRVLKECSHIYLFIPTLEIDKWVEVVKKYFSFNNLLSTQTYLNKRYLKNNFGFDLQLIIFASKGKAKRLNAVDWIPASDSWRKDKRNPNPKSFTYKYPSVIPPNICRANIKYNRTRKRFHPNEKNPDLIEKFILLSSCAGDIVLDPFMGSGPTIIACIRNCRKYIGFENTYKYYLYAKQREEEELKK